MKKCGMVLALTLCVFLSACGEKESREETSFLGQAAELEEAEPLMSVDGREVPAWRYLYWLASACDQVRARYEAADLSLEWDTPVADGTLAEYVQERALADTVLYATVENWAERYGCTLEAADQAALAEEWAEKTKDGEDGYLIQLRDQGLNKSRAEELAGVGLLYGKLYRLYGAEGSALAPETGEVEEFAQRQGILTVDRILIAAGDDKEAARRRASEIFAKLNSAADQAAAFPTLAAMGDDPAGVRTLRVGDGTLDPVLEKGAAALEVGQCSGILESAEGFSILRRLPGNTKTLRGEYFDYQLQNAAERAEVVLEETALDLEVASFYQKLEQMRLAGGRE